MTGDKGHFAFSSGNQAQAGFERSEELAAEKAMEWMRQGVLLRIQRSTGYFLKG